VTASLSGRGAVLAALLCLVWAPALAAPVVVIAREPSEAADPALREVAAELAQRCPARQVAYAPWAPRLPRFVHEIAEPPVPDVLADPSAEFFRSEDPLGSAMRFRKAATELAREPAALLSRPDRRLRMHDAYLYAARGFLQAARPADARTVLIEAATRLPDRPAPSAARWGPALAAAAEEARRALPAQTQPVLIEGPAGWAVHVDEQPLGVLPRQRALLRPGPHAVVAVGTDGTRATWQLEIGGAPAEPLRLLADPRLEEVCASGDQVALCAGGAPPAGAQALVALFDSDVIVLRRRRDLVLGWRLGRSSAGAPASAAAAGPAALARALCAPVLAEERLALSGGRDRVRPARWPGALLMGIGAGLAIGAVPLLVQQGRCVDEDCTRVYEFRGLHAGLLGAGAALTVGGAIWLIVALRR
jgi:hypothetical protein